MEEVVRLKKQLEKAVQESDADQVLDLLGALDRIPITVDVLGVLDPPPPPGTSSHRSNLVAHWTVCRRRRSGWPWES